MNSNTPPDKPRKILIAVALGGIYSGGAHQALYQLAGFKKAGLELMAVWGPDEENDPRGFDRLKALQIPFKILPINKKPTWDSIKAFRKIIIDFNPDVIECFKSGAHYHALYGGYGLNRHALVVYRGISRTMDIWQGLKYRLSRVDSVLGNCPDLCRIMHETGHIPKDKLDYVYDEADPACMELDKIDATGFKRKLKIPEDVRLITQLGNWSPWRGQHVTLEAASILKKRGFQFHILFCGRETDKLRSIISEYGLEKEVTTSLYRRDPERVLKASDIKVNASTSHESFPGSLNNAQTIGLPAVATRMPGSNVIVEHGVTGYIIEPNEPVQLADALQKLLILPEEELKAMGSRARDRALAKFGSDVRTIRRLLVYEKALAHRKSMLGYKNIPVINIPDY